MKLKFEENDFLKAASDQDFARLAAFRAQSLFDKWYEGLTRVYGFFDGDGASHFSELKVIGSIRGAATHQGRLIVEGPIEKPCGHPHPERMIVDRTRDIVYVCHQCNKSLRPTGWEAV